MVELNVLVRKVYPELMHIIFCSLFTKIKAKQSIFIADFYYGNYISLLLCETQSKNTIFPLELNNKNKIEVFAVLNIKNLSGKLRKHLKVT